MWITFIGNFDLGHRIGVEYLRSEHTNLTLSSTKRGTDLGALVVPFDHTCHPLHRAINQKLQLRKAQKQLTYSTLPEILFSLIISGYKVVQLSSDGLKNKPSQYSQDLKSDDSKSRNIRNPDFLKIKFKILVKLLAYFLKIKIQAVLHRIFYWQISKISESCTFNMSAAIGLVPTITKMEHLKSGHFCRHFKWFFYKYNQSYSDMFHVKFTYKITLKYLH